MLKLTKTGIGLLTKQYRSVLRKCWSINVGLFTITSVLATMASNEAISEIVYNEASDRAGITLKTESTFHVGEGGNGFLVYNIDQESTNNTVAWLYNDWTGGGRLDLYDTERTVKTYLSYKRFQLNNSSVVADGITASVIQNSRNLITSGGVYDALNYYYTKTEADARYALLDTIGDVDYSDEAEDEGSALKNGEEDSPTTVRGALDLLDTKIGDLNETGIAGNDVATQLKYILENGSTGGAGVTLSTLGYIGANTPYLNTTNEAMNFSSTYTIGGNMATLANQIKTNETNISNLSSRVNLLGTYSNGSANISENYAKVIGNTSIVTNSTELSHGGNIIQPYATLQDVNLKSYTVEITTPVVSTAERRLYRIQVNAPSEEEAIVKAKNKIINSGWSNSTLQAYGDNIDRYYNKYMYGRLNSNDEQLDPIGIVDNVLDSMNDAIQATNDVKVTKNNYKVAITIGDGGGRWSSSTYTVYVNAENKAQAREKAEDLIMEGFYIDDDGIFDNIYDSYQNGHWYTILESTKTSVQTGLDTATSETKTKVAEGSLGTINTYALGSHTIIENIALLDNAIGDLGTTGVSGASVAAQLKLLGEVGSEALGQKIGSWSTTKDSISQTLGEETKNYGYLTAFEYDSENEQYVGTVGDNLQALDTALSLTAKGLDALSHQLYNYYYTFRVDERIEAAEFAKELRSNKKEMSSLDFMPIKSSSDLRINLIKAEDPLTFSTKTRDDSLDLMEVCHA